SGPDDVCSAGTHGDSSGCRRTKFLPLSQKLVATRLHAAQLQSLLVNASNARTAAPLPDDLSVRHSSRDEELPSGPSSRLSSPERCRILLSHRRHRRRMAVEAKLVLATSA